ncbi:MAG: membrane protein insertion efficiency factor YidD [Actinomycetota bacterium]
MITILRPSTVVILLIKTYQSIVSPWTYPCCRFYPSCSSYALTAFSYHGFFRAFCLTVARLLRCHPWNPGGLDFVPPSSRRKVSESDEN